MKTKTFVVNLGLNNNPCMEQECIDILKGGHLSPLASFTSFITHMGEYEGRPEPTLVMKMVVSDYKLAEDVVRKMCTKFTQQCIAIRQEGAEEHAGELIWNEALTDRPYTFDAEYFIDPFRRDENDVRSRIMSKLGK